ncbi:unnamed protein product [Trifolium pratense]|uniref:Uncharacterized protein n=1 Tax=Trifolium pratense TaxID=57577 RepID=A0ACB0L138_TRIPR|nr:unnamed protein product [Trifolium pratense]
MFWISKVEVAEELDKTGLRNKQKQQMGNGMQHQNKESSKTLLVLHIEEW